MRQVGRLGRLMSNRQGKFPLQGLSTTARSGLAVALSVRCLLPGYHGPCVRVRRSSDNAEQDIYFLPNGNLDITSLTTFVGAGNGFATTWYDQSGNGRHQTQATAASQPIMVASGTPYTQGGRYLLYTDGGNDFMSGPVPSLTAHTILSVLWGNTSGSDCGFYNYSNNLTYQGVTQHLGGHIYSYTGSGGKYIRNTKPLQTHMGMVRKWNGVTDTSGWDLTLNGAANTLVNGTPDASNADTTMYLSRLTSYFSIKFQEHIVFSSYLPTEDLTRLSASIASYYGASVVYV